MLHVSVCAVFGSVLFRNWGEAADLWVQITDRVTFRALCLMPDHIHLMVADARQCAPLTTALRGYALKRNHARGESGAVWQHDAKPMVIPNHEHDDRTWRYILLNPCRKNLVRDPLAWPFSTHRDSVGLVASPVCRPARNPARFHSWVSSDPTVKVVGTPLPVESRAAAGAQLVDVLNAVSAVTRTTAARLKRPGAPRDLLIGLCRALTACSAGDIAAFAAVHATTVYRAAAPPPALLGTVRRVLGDPRFPLLHDRDLRTDPAWHEYRYHR
jgi:hypothetical protein